jgi:predicted porin
MWQSSQPNVVRTRLRAGVRYEAGKLLHVIAYNECLTNVAGAPAGHTYDHNRVAGGASYQCTPWLRTEAGYLYIDRLPLANVQHVYEHNIYLNVVTDIGKLLHPVRH